LLQTYNVAQDVKGFLLQRKLGVNPVMCQEEWHVDVINYLEQPKNYVGAWPLEEEMRV